MQPDFILFAQHGWADTNQHMAALAKDLATEATKIVAPSLNYAMTWLRITPLIDNLDRLATAALANHPEAPLRIIGHSMGGLIWLEVLNRHPDWWPRVHSLVLVASPVGGADLGRIIDPLKVGIGIAADLGQDRRPLACRIAASINTLSLAGDVDGGSDGTITIETAKVPSAQFLTMEGLDHAAMRHHPLVIETIRRFWAGENLSEPLTLHPVIEQLRAIPGMTDAHPRDIKWSTPFVTLPDGATVRTWQHPLGIDHVFVVSERGDCLYSGFVGWLNRENLWQALHDLEQVTLAARAQVNANAVATTPRTEPSPPAKDAGQSDKDPD
ncbi:MAG: lysophospholipase [Leptolyngbyaceae cyanobacterium SM2_5_2]|nr:lysophospholipase [Leptolyngbyaceae cyanobacterium SM2_5_2]